VDPSDSVDPVALAAVPADPVDPAALAVLAVDPVDLAVGPVDLVADHAVLAVDPVDLAVGLVDLAAVPVGPSAGAEHSQPCEISSPNKPQ